MRAQATVEGIEHVVRNGFGSAYEGRAPSAMAPPGGDIVTPMPIPVTDSVRIEPVRWSVIIAGAFSALATLGLLVLFAGMLALPPFLPNALKATPAAAPLVILVALVVAFLGLFVGGWVASRLSVIHTVRTAMLAGALVWAVCIPIIASATMAARFLAPETDAAVISARGPMFRGVQPAPDANAERLALGDRMQLESGVGFFAVILSLGGAVIGGLIGSAGRSRNTPKPRRLHDVPSPIPQMP